MTPHSYHIDHQGLIPRACWISLFFDGQGHDLEADALSGRQSNIAKLFRTHPNAKPEGIYRFYYRGSGVLSEDLGPLAGSAAPATSSLTTDSQTTLNRALYDLAQTFQETASPLPYQIALFGFGRGAALAWALSLHLDAQGIADLRGQRDRFRIGEDFQIRFVGLIDTLGTFSLGSFAANVASLSPIPTSVDQVLHCVAAHERRALFDLQSLRASPTEALPPNQREELYPGMHSDVGGGYAEGDQGRSNSLARLPLNAMLDAARSQGVPFVSLEQLQVLDEALYREYQIPPILQRLYDDYCLRLPPETDLYRTLAHHECLYFRWLRSVLDSPASLHHALMCPPPNSNHPAEERLYRAYQELTEQYEALRWRQRFLEGGFPEFNAPNSAFHPKRDEQLAEDDVLYRHRGDWALVVKPIKSFERDMLTWMKIAEPLPETLRLFFARYVHDAIAHTPGTGGDLYFQRRSLYFRHSRPWRG